MTSHIKHKQQQFKLPPKEKLTNIESALESCSEKLKDFGGLEIITLLLPDNLRDSIEDVIDFDELVFRDDFTDFLAAKQLVGSFDVIKDALQEVKGDEETFADNLVDCLDEKKVQVKKDLKENVNKVFNKSTILEKSYRAATLLLDNTGKSEDLLKIHFVNATMKQLQSSSIKKDSTNFIHTIGDKIRKGFDDASLKENYSLMQINGFLGEGKDVVETKELIKKWAKVSNDNCVMLVTDYKECSNHKDLNRFNKSGLRGDDEELKSVVLCGNYAIGRKRTEYEDEELLINPSSIFCGAYMKDEEISQAKTDRTFGKTKGVLGTNHTQFYSQAGNITHKGINILHFSNALKDTMLKGNATLCNKEGADEVSVVRTKFYIYKFIRDYLNKITGIKIDNKVKKGIERKIRAELEKFEREGLIRGFGDEIEVIENYNDTTPLMIKVEIDFSKAATNIELEIVPNK